MRAVFGQTVRGAGPGLLLYAAWQSNTTHAVRLRPPHFTSSRILHEPLKISCALQASDEGSFGDLRSRSIPSSAPTEGHRAIFLVACLATAMAAISRVIFSVLAIPIQMQYGLASTDLALLQSALLMGYTVGQIPSGLVADRLGGAPTLVIGLVAWSLASSAFAAAPLVPEPFLFMIVTRFLLGLAQSVLMPGVSATAAQWFAPEERAVKTSSVYAWYNIGTVIGLSGTPLVAELVGWPLAMFCFGSIGIFGGLIAMKTLPWAAKYSATTKANQSQQRTNKLDVRLLKIHAKELGLLCWTHAAIGFGFFVLQAWTPVYLHSIGGDSLGLATVGLLSAAPWMASALVASLGGGVAGWAENAAGWAPLRVRRTAQIASHLGSVVALAPLAIASPGSVTPAWATLALVAAVGVQGLNYAGFHAYVQDVAPRDAGLVLGCTNTCSILAGIAGNVLTGGLTAGGFGFSWVFGLTAGLYAASALTWWAGARGKPLRMT